MDKITDVRFETTETKRSNFSTYSIRFLDADNKPQMSTFVQWDKPLNIYLSLGRSMVYPQRQVRRNLEARTCWECIEYFN